MSEDMKYIMFDNSDPIIFPLYWDHRETANKFPEKTPTSAGFVYLHNGKFLAYGQSYSLKLISESEADTKTLNRLLSSD